MLIFVVNRPLKKAILPNQNLGAIAQHALLENRLFYIRNGLVGEGRAVAALCIVVFAVYFLKAIQHGGSLASYFTPQRVSSTTKKLELSLQK